MLIVTGDYSGDIYASLLVKRLREISENLRIYGVGGQELSSSGVTFLENLVDHAVVGISESFRKILKLRDVLKRMKIFMEKEKPDALVLIDYPGFNLRLAEEAKKREIDVFYYVGPQIWAWGYSRIKKLARLIKRMLVILPFEEKIYKEAGIPVTFVGHPILDILREKSYGGPLKGENPVIGLLPGSRPHEISRHLPVMLKVAEGIQKEVPSSTFMLLAAPTIEDRYLNTFLEKQTLSVEVFRENGYQTRKKMMLSLVASGTATLENACLGIPMVIIYKTSLLTYCIGKLLVTVPAIGLPNLIAGEKIIPEFIQGHIKTGEISRMIVSWLKNPERMNVIREKLKSVREQLGAPGASVRAAGIIWEEISP